MRCNVRVMLKILQVPSKVRSSAVRGLVEVIIAIRCSVQAYAIRVLAKAVQIYTRAGEVRVKMFALVWRRVGHPPSFGFPCRK